MSVAFVGVRKARKQTECPLSGVPMAALGDRDRLERVVSERSQATTACAVSSNANMGFRMLARHALGTPDER